MAYAKHEETFGDYKYTIIVDQERKRGNESNIVRYLTRLEIDKVDDDGYTTEHLGGEYYSCGQWSEWHNEHEEDDFEEASWDFEGEFVGDDGAIHSDQCAINDTFKFFEEYCHDNKLFNRHLSPSRAEQRIMEYRIEHALL